MIRSIFVRNFGRLNPQRISQIHQMFLFLDDNAAQNLAEGKFAHGISLTNPLAVILNRYALVFQIELEHGSSIFRRLYRYRFHRGLAAEIVDLLGDLQCMAQFLGRMRFQFASDVRIGGTLQGLAIHNIRDYCLVLPCQVLIEDTDHFLTG